MRALKMLPAVLLLGSNLSYGSLQPKKPSNWSHFFSFLNSEKFELPKVRFEFGVMAYYASFSDWNFTRVEPFVKLRYSILDKYINVYTMFTMDTPSVMNYNLSEFSLNDMEVAVRAKLFAAGSPSFGGGLQFFVFGWKNLNVHAYAQIQTASSNEASLERAVLSVNKQEINIYEQIRPFVNVSYDFKRYDIGQTASYQFLRWFGASLSMGYIWLKAKVKINISQDLENAIKKIAGASDKDLIPESLNLDESNIFALLSLKFTVHRRIHILIEGTVLPASKPVYYGLLSLTIDGDR